MRSATLDEEHPLMRHSFQNRDPALIRPFLRQSSIDRTPIMRSTPLIDSSNNQSGFQNRRDGILLSTREEPVPALRRSRATRHPIFRRNQQHAAAVDPIMEDDEDEDSVDDNFHFEDVSPGIPHASATMAIS